MTGHVYYYSLCSLLIIVCNADYWTVREELIDRERSQTIGANVTLNSFELEVDKLLLALKRAEIDRGFDDPRAFLPAKHFFRARESIGRSKVFQFVRRVPKGCSLHGHDFALTAFDYIYNVTYYDHLYACIANGGKLRLHFFKSPVADRACDWKLVSEWRAANGSFDGWLKSEMTLVVPHPESTYIDIDAVWTKFSSIFALIVPLLTYKPVLQELTYQYLLELYEDNVRYGEFRGILPDAYDLDGRIYDQYEVIEMYIETLDAFTLHYRDFQGVRFIYAPSRNISNKTLAEHVETARSLKRRFPHFVAGFDLVGQEDLGRPLAAFVDQLQNLSKEMHVFYHAGETNWYGESTDLNVFDAILLGAKRIGHGYALTKHPEALRLVKERNVAVEVNPISNQVLKLVDDMRNHPASLLIGQGYPIVISNDDPALWGSKALSYDWYVAFLGMTARDVGLKFLKQLAINSYTYNSMSDAERSVALKEWQADWDRFILNVYRESLSFYPIIFT